MPYNNTMFSFIETRLFTKLVLDYMTDDEYSALQIAHDRSGGWTSNPGLGRCPQASLGGAGSRQTGRLSRDLLRPSAHGVIWMLTMYPKNVADNIPAHVLRQIRKEVEDG
jgi:hypothetical protein